MKLVLALCCAPVFNFASALQLSRRGFGAAAGTFVALSSASSASAAADRSCGDGVVGTYTDPNHKGCFRRVATISGTRFASVSGADEDEKPWVVKATLACPGYQGIDAPQLLVDFSPKGGPKDVTAVFSTSGPGKTDGKLTFPDGNVWTMVPCTNPKLTKKQVEACQASK